MKTVIETYRGIEIYFETDKEVFTYAFDGLGYNQKQSYSACKKSIDEFYKTNSSFKPFKASRKDGSDIKEFVGIRKDGRLVYLNEKGEKEQFSEYNEKEYILFDEKNIPLFNEIGQLIDNATALRKKADGIIDSIKGVSVRDYKSTL